jgi:hypothetical protein
LNLPVARSTYLELLASGADDGYATMYAEVPVEMPRSLKVEFVMFTENVVDVSDAKAFIVPR